MAGEGIQEKIDTKAAPESAPIKDDAGEVKDNALDLGSDSGSDSDLSGHVLDVRIADSGNGNSELETANTADKHLEPIDIVGADSGQGEEDKLDIATLLKTDFLGGNSKRYEWLNQNATEKDIEDGIRKKVADGEADWHAGAVQAKDAEGQKFKDGDIVTFEKDGQVQLAVVREVGGEIGFQVHNNRSGVGEPIERFKKLSDAFPGLTDDSTIKVYSDRPVDTSATGQAVERTETAPEREIAAAGEPEVKLPDVRSLLAERTELLSSDKKPEDVIEVKRGEESVNMTVAERLKEIETDLIGDKQPEGASEVIPIVRLDALDRVDPVYEAIKEGSDKLRVHDVVIKASVLELTDMQKQGLKPEDKVTVVRMVDGRPQEQEVTVEERVRELKTNIKDELARYQETAERVSPSPANPAVTREVDIKLAETVAERTELARKLGIFDQRQLTVEGVDAMTPRNAEERADLTRLRETIVKTDRIQDVRHGLAFTKLRSAEMKALGYANPELGLNQTGTAADSNDAFVDLAHARQVDRELRASQSAYDVEIIVSSKVAPLLLNTDQALRVMEAERKANETGMTIEDTIKHAMEQETKAKEVEALMVLGKKESTNEEKTEAIDILMELRRASKASGDLDIKTEEDALRMAAEKAKDLDIGFLNSEAMKDYYRMRGIDGSVVDPDDTSRTVPSFSERFQAIANVGARAKLEYAIMLRERGQSTYTGLTELGTRYQGKDLSQAIESAKNSGRTNDQQVLEKIARDNFGDDPNSYKGVRLGNLLEKSRDSIDDASMLFLEVKNDAPHMIYKQTESGFDYQNDTLKALDYHSTMGISSVNPAEWVAAKQRFDQVAQGKSAVDENGRPIDARAELEKMYRVTRMVELDVERQNKKLQEKIEEMKQTKEGLPDKEFATEEARQLEQERIEREIKLLEGTIEQREKSVLHQRNLTRYMDATFSFGQEDFSHARKMLDLIKSEDPELYKNEELNMEELHGQSSSWWKRNWRMVAAGVTIAVAVGIGVATAGLGSGVSGVMIAGALSMAGGAAAGYGIHAGLGYTATGRWEHEAGIDGAKLGARFAGLGYGGRLIVGAGGLQGMHWLPKAATYAGAGFAPSTIAYTAPDLIDYGMGDRSKTLTGIAMETGVRGLGDTFLLTMVGGPASTGTVGRILNPNIAKLNPGYGTLANTAKFVGANEVYGALYYDGMSKVMDHFSGGEHDPKFNFMTGDRSAYDHQVHTGHGILRNLAARSWPGGRNLDLQDSREYARFLHNMEGSGAIFGLREATTENLLFRNQNLPFQLRPVQPTVRKVFIPEYSSQPMVQTVVDGRPVFFPLSGQAYDSDAARPNRLQFRVDELTSDADKPHPLGLRIGR